MFSIQATLNLHDATGLKINIKTFAEILLLSCSNQNVYKMDRQMPKIKCSEANEKRKRKKKRKKSLFTVKIGKTNFHDNFLL